MNESMMADLEERRRLDEQRHQAAASMWDPVKMDLEESLILHWRGMGQ